MNRIAVFDFDGTITHHDTFLLFIKFAKGKGRFYIGFILFSPMIVLWKIGIIKNWQAKQMVFSWFFRGCNMNRFNQLGTEFISSISEDVREKAMTAISQHLQNGDHVVIVSASMENWIVPWAESIGISTVLATQIEVSGQNKLTGKFSSKNCHGKEKIERLVAKFPDLLSNRGDYSIIAYGDSSGDKDLLEFSNEGFLNHFK